MFRALAQSEQLFNRFQEYLGTFRNIDAYLVTLTGAQLGRKKFPYFGKKGPDCVFDEMFVEVPYFHKPLLLP